MTSLQKRLYVSFGLALVLILICGGFSIYFIDSLGSDVKNLVGENYQGLNVILAQNQRNLLMILMIVIASGIVLLFVAPHKASLPLKKMLLAFREAEEGNLSVRISNIDDKNLSEFAVAFNRLVGQMEDLDNMRLKKIAFEQRRFECLANLMDAAVFVCTVEGQIVFVNSQVYRAFGLASKQVLSVPLENVPLPQPMAKLMTEAVSRQERVEDMPWELQFDRDGTPIRCSLAVDILPISRHTGEIVNLLFVMEERDRPRTERIFRREGR